MEGEIPRERSARDDRSETGGGAGTCFFGGAVRALQMAFRREGQNGKACKLGLASMIFDLYKESCQMPMLHHAATFA